MYNCTCPNNNNNNENKEENLKQPLCIHPCPSFVRNPSIALSFFTSGYDLVNRNRPSDRSTDGYIISRCQLPCINLYTAEFYSSMIDSCRLPCRIRVDTAWKVGKGGGSTDKKGGGRRTAGRVTSNPGETELQKENVRAAFLSPLRRSPPKSLGPVKRFRVTSRNFFSIRSELSSAQVPWRALSPPLPFPSLHGYCFYPAIRFSRRPIRRES